jgi:hypothetical protein
MGKRFKSRTVAKESITAKTVAKASRRGLRKLLVGIAVELTGVILIFLFTGISFYGLRWLGFDEVIAFQASALAGVASLIAGGVKPVEQEGSMLGPFGGFVIGVALGAGLLMTAGIPLDGRWIGKMVLCWSASTFLMVPAVWLMDKGERIVKRG